MAVTTWHPGGHPVRWAAILVKYKKDSLYAKDLRVDLGRYALLGKLPK
jgi:hypothetical protein